MHGLLSRLGALDSGAERGLRVVEFFDQLVLHNAGLEAVTRATAVLAEMTAGAVLDEQGQICCVATDGRSLPPAGPGSQALVHDVRVDGESVGRVWLERGSARSDVHEWDELIIERMAIAVATLQARKQDSVRGSLSLSDPATLHLLINEATSESEAARAARLLGFHVGALVRVIAVESTTLVDVHLPAVRRAVAAASGRVVVAALSSTLAVILAATSDAPGAVPPDGVAVCVGPAQPVEACSGSWKAARKGVRFAGLGGLWPRWTTTEALGCLITLADLDPAAVAAQQDVQAITRLAATKSGASDIALLDKFGSLSSVRETATALHMHHSSVNYRLETLSSTLGYDLRSPEGRYRVRTALILWQLHVT